MRISVAFNILLRKIATAYGFGFSFCYKEVMRSLFGKSRLPLSNKEITNLKKINRPKALVDAIKFLYFETDFDFNGKKVLEIGGSNIPFDLIFNKLKVANWTCVDYLDKWTQNLVNDKTEDNFCIFPLDNKSQPFNCDFQYLKYNGDASNIPETFYEQFDAVISLSCFEHVFNLHEVIDKIFRCLKPDGLLLSYFAPIWSSRFGHHYWFSQRYSHSNCLIDNIPPFIHLLHSEAEVRRILVGKIPPEAIDNLCHFSFSDNQNCTNRLFFEDYEKIMKNSQFSKFKITPFNVFIPKQIMKALQSKFPNYKKFNASGMCILAQR